jgi:hypothetical protein
MAWLRERKVLLPGVTTLARLVARVRDDTTHRLWRELEGLLTPARRRALDRLLEVRPGERVPDLERWRKGPAPRGSGPAITKALDQVAEIAYPWEWRPADAEEFIAHLRSPNRNRPIAMSTGRGYETTLALFMGYLTDRRYGWPEECLRRFGKVPQQIFHEDNRVAHVAGYEGAPGRRPLTYDEVQALFDVVDSRVEEARARGRKGALTAMRENRTHGSMRRGLETEHPAMVTQRSGAQENPGKSGCGTSRRATPPRQPPTLPAVARS